MALSEVASTQAKLGMQAEAAATFCRSTANMAAGIEYAGERAWALSAIASAQAEAGDTAGALQTVAGIEDAYPRVVALSEVASTQAKWGCKRRRQRVLPKH